MDEYGRQPGWSSNAAISTCTTAAAALPSRTLHGVCPNGSGGHRRGAAEARRSGAALQRLVLLWVGRRGERRGRWRGGGIDTPPVRAGGVYAQPGAGRVSDEGLDRGCSAAVHRQRHDQHGHPNVHLAGQSAAAAVRLHHGNPVVAQTWLGAEEKGSLEFIECCVCHCVGLSCAVCCLRTLCS